METVAGGGCFTAPFHAAAGNREHASRAAAFGLSKLAGAATTEAAGAIVEVLGLNGTKEIRLSDSMAQPGGNSEGDREDQDLPQGKQDKTPENACQLSAESGGRRLLRSIHGTYLRAHKVEWKVDMAPQAGSWEQWYIEDWGGKVVLKAIHSPGRFLRAFPDGAIDLMDRPETWIPFKNDDGSWSFQSIHGRWLSAEKNGSVSTVVNRKSWEHFWLLPW